MKFATLQTYFLDTRLEALAEALLMSTNNV